MSNDSQGDSRTIWQWGYDLIRGRVHQDRLEEALLQAEAAHNELKLRAEKSGSDPKLGVIATIAKQHLDHAKVQRRRSKFIAWGALGQFDNAMLAALDLDDRKARWCSFINEAEKKLKGTWRADAVNCLKEFQKNEEKSVSPSVSLLQELHRHIVTRAQNDQFKLRFAQRYGIPVVSGALFLVVVFALNMGLGGYWPKNLPPEVKWAKPLLIAVLSGILGGILSMALHGRTNLQSTIPELRMSFLVTLTRPLLGGAAAIPVMVLVQSEYVSVKGLEGNMAILVFCMLAGLSERWFIDLMDRLGADTK